MAKYIDADKLVAGLKHLQEKFEFLTYEAIYHLIESLQQEQLSEGLEKAAEEYVNGVAYFGKDIELEKEQSKRDFIAGAEWGAIHLNSRKEE